MNPWLDGLTVLTTEWRLTAVIFLAVIGGQSIVSFFLRAVFGERITPAERLALGLGGWAFPFLFLSLLWYFTGWDELFWILPAAPIFFLLSRLRPDLKPALRLPSLFLILFFFLSLPLRLAYPSQTDLPLYFDSAQHYLIIKTLLSKNQSLLWGWLNISYYHFGFHFLAAFLAKAAGAEPARVILVLGQVILLTLPFSFFFIVRHETNSNAAGGFALLLASFGWYMPTHAVNWGKYPALMSVGMLAWLWAMALIVFRHQTDVASAKRRASYAVWTVCAALTVLTHTRALIVLGILIPAWAMAAWLERRSRRWMRTVLFVITAAAIWVGWMVFRQSLLASLFAPYLQKGIPLAALLLPLLPFAWMVFPRITFVSFASIALLLGSLMIPLSHPLVGRDLTLLDRPFVELILFLPLSLLGGAGLAGVEKLLQGRLLWRRAIVLLAAGIVVVNTAFRYELYLYPSQCCVIVGTDDVTAIAWTAAQLPLDARIGISAMPLDVLPDAALEGDVGADAGVWITPLTGRETRLFPFFADFSQRAALDILCRDKISHLFVGERGQPFHRSLLDSRPDWYRPLLSMPNTAVYEVTGCAK
ncbi:MAG: hypothetical protein HRF47_17575 [Chloroflexota bacterium]|jgi:hypothetical protein